MERFNVLQDLFFTLLTFLKYAGYAILWEYLLERDLELPNELKSKMRHQLGRDWFDGQMRDIVVEDMVERVNFLLEVYQYVNLLGVENPFFQEGYSFIHQNREQLLSACAVFSQPPMETPNQKTLLLAEQFLYFFVEKTSFLMHYELASVGNSIFSKYRIEGGNYAYTIKYFDVQKGVCKERKDPQVSNLQIYDVYSIVLKNKRESVDYQSVINLSPFFIDNNIGGNISATNQIDLYFLRRYTLSRGKLLYRNMEKKTQKIELQKDKTNVLNLKHIRIGDHFDDLLTLI